MVSVRGSSFVERSRMHFPSRGLGNCQRPRGRSRERGATACHDCCALQVGTANFSAIVQNAHVAGLAVVAAAAAGCTFGHALVPAAGEACLA